MKTSLLQESRRDHKQSRRDHKPGKTPKIKKAKDLIIRNKAKSEKTPKKTRTRSNRVLNKDGEAQVFLFIYLDHQRVQFPTGIFLKPNHRDKNKSLVRRPS